MLLPESRTFRYAVPFESPAFHGRMLRDSKKYASIARALAPIVSGRRVLDIGTGSGVIAAIAAGLSARHVVALDRSPIVEFARATRDRLPREQQCRIEVVGSDFESFWPDSSFDVVISETVGYLGLEEGIVPIATRARRDFSQPSGIVLPRAISARLIPARPEVGGASAPFLATIPQPTALPWQEVDVREPAMLESVDWPYVWRSTWWSHSDSVVGAIQVRVSADLGRGEAIGNAESEVWPVCIVPLKSSLQVPGGHRIRLELSISPREGAYEAVVEVFVEGQRCLLQAFMSTDIEARCEFPAKEFSVEQVASLAADMANAAVGVAAG